MPLESEQGRTAVLVGATGLVGSALLRVLVADERFASVAVLGRRSTGVAHAKVREHLVDLGAPASFRSLVVGDVLFSALGTTLRAAGGRDAQYRVDHDYQFEVGKAARANGVRTCVVVSSAHASPRSRVFYSRMKGEIERDIEALGFARTRFLRPGPLDGARAEVRRGEQLALRLLRPLARVLPAVARPVHAAIVARAAIEAALDATPGVVRYEAADIFRVGTGRSAG